MWPAAARGDRPGSGKPVIILADKPIGNLDSRTSADVLDLLQRTSREFKTFILYGTRFFSRYGQLRELVSAFPSQEHTVHRCRLCANNRKSKKVLCMVAEEFEGQTGGGTLHGRLRKVFSKYCHIMARDATNYNQNSYTLVEFNVIVDKPSYALQDFEYIPVDLIRIPGAAPSTNLSNLFRYSFIDTYN